MRQSNMAIAGGTCLALEGLRVQGFVRSVDGGFIKGEVGTHELGPSLVQKKNITSISYEPFTFDVGLDLSAGFYEWLQATFGGKYAARDGEFVLCDGEQRAMSSREFTEAHIAEVKVPALDASSTEPAYMTIKLDPATIHYKPGHGGVVATSDDVSTSKWLASNFKVEIGNLPTSRVSRVDSFTVRQHVDEEELADARRSESRTVRTEVPNIRLTISMADLDPWQDWHRSFLIDGRCSDADELNGMISFLGPDLRTEMARIDLRHIGLISLKPLMPSVGAYVAVFEVEMYVEQMTFERFG